jgi:hypothetical protein
MRNTMENTMENIISNLSKWGGQDEVVQVGEQAYRVQIMHDEWAESPREWDNTGEIVMLGHGGKKYEHLTDEWIRDQRRRQKQEREVSQGRWQTGWRSYDTPEPQEFFAGLVGYNVEDENEKYGQEMPDEWHNTLIEARVIKQYVLRSLDIHEHGGITIKDSSFSMSDFDGSGRYTSDGVIYAKLDNSGNNKNDPNSNKNDPNSNKNDPDDDTERAQLEWILQTETRLYADYLEGNCWGFIVSKQMGIDEDGEPVWEDVDSCWGFYGDHDTSGLFDGVTSALQRGGE